MSTFLTPDEIRELTGYVQIASQRRWLTDRGWKHEVNALGRPIVLRSEMERHMLTGAKGHGKAARQEWLDREFAARLAEEKPTGR